MDVLKKFNKKNNEYNTPFTTWELIKDLLPLNGTVWEPFWNETTQSSSHLERLGCSIVAFEPCDFFKVEKCPADFIISNPPFQNKKKVFEHLKKLNAPFIIIIPVHSICCRFIKNYFKNELQIIIPDKRLHYEVDGKLQTKTPFDSVFICYKMNLPSDIMFL